MLTEIQQQQIKTRGISEKDVIRQISDFKNGFPFMRIEKAATIDDGIIKLSEDQLKEFINNFDLISINLKIIKMVL